MKGVFKWLGKLISRVIALLLVIILLPYASKLALSFLPDWSGMAVNTSITLSKKLSESARLETNRLDIEGVLDSSVSALLIGTVQSVKIAYTYRASVGIDMSKVQLHIRGNTLKIELPELEILSDSLTPTEIVRSDFWYPLTDERRQSILNAEQDRRAQETLAELNASDDAWANTINAFETTISEWIRMGNSRLTIEYIRPGESV